MKVGNIVRLKACNLKQWPEYEGGLARVIAIEPCYDEIVIIWLTNPVVKEIWYANLFERVTTKIGDLAGAGGSTSFDEYKGIPVTKLTYGQAARYLDKAETAEEISYLTQCCSQLGLEQEHIATSKIPIEQEDMEMKL